MSLEIELRSENHSDESYSYNRSPSNYEHSNEKSGVGEQDEDEYVDPSTNDLTIATGAALIVADCMGTGILALPYNINITLGREFGLFFLILNVLINLYAGTILCNVALLVEQRLSLNNNIGIGTSDELYNSNVDVDDGDGKHPLNKEGVSKSHNTNISKSKPRSSSTGSMESYHSMESTHSNDWNYYNDSYDKKEQEKNGETREKIQINSTRKDSYDAMASNSHSDEEEHNCHLEKLTKSTHNNNEINIPTQNYNPHHDSHGDAHTFDFIGLTTALFDYSTVDPNQKNTEQIQHKHDQRTTTSNATLLVLITYYTNIFLVLGNYILVMSHAVAAMVGENNICIPNAGLIAVTFMFGLCQMRSMSSLGHSVSFMSLAALAIVVVQCLFSIKSGNNAFTYSEGGGYGGGERRGLNVDDDNDDDAMNPNFLQALARQFAAVSSIGFAVGSQKVS